MENELEQSLLQTLRESDLAELSAEASDSMLRSLDCIPVVGTLRKLFNAAGNVSTYLFTKKMIRFLAELGTVAPEQRTRQLAKLFVVPGELKKVGEHILLLLDKLDEIEKAAMMGKAFRAFLEEQLELGQLRSLNRAIDRLNVDDIEVLKLFYADRQPVRVMSGEWFQDLAICGLVSLEFAGDRELLDDCEGIGTYGHQLVSGQIAYRPNHLGYLFLKFALEESVEPPK